MHALKDRTVKNKYRKNGTPGVNRDIGVKLLFIWLKWLSEKRLNPGPNIRNSRKGCGGWWNILLEFVHCTISFGKKRQKWRSHVGPNLAIFYYGKIVLNQILFFFHSITSLAVVKKHSWQWPNVHYFYNGKKIYNFKQLLNSIHCESTAKEKNCC